MGLRLPTALFLTACAAFALAAPPAAAAATEAAPGASSFGAAACTPTTLVRVCVESLDCIAVYVLGQPFAIVGCA